jgi:hypothetical protein
LARIDKTEAPAQQEPRCPTCGSTERNALKAKFVHDSLGTHKCFDFWHDEAAAGKPEEPR